VGGRNLNSLPSLSDKIHNYFREISGGLAYWEILLLSVLTLLCVGITWAYMAFAGELGFNMYPQFHVVLLALLLLGLPLFSRLERRLSSGNSAVSKSQTLGLILVLAITFALRVFYALVASLFPDEYWVLLVLESHPWRNLGYFFSNYFTVSRPLTAHPPLSFLLMSIAYEIFPSPTSARMMSVIFGTATVAVFYFVLRELGGGKYALPVAALYGLFPHTLLYMSAALTDVYMNFFGLLSILLGIKSIRSGRVRFSVFSGVALGMSLLSKQGLGIFWEILLLFAMWLVRPKQVSLIRALGVTLLSLGLGSGVFSLWYFANPWAFLLTVLPVVRYLMIVPWNPQAYQLGNCCFQVVNGMAYNISYADLILQLPLWLTPLAILMALVGVGLSLRQHRREDIWWVLWALGPLLAMIPRMRDIRYALFIAPAAAYLAWIGVGGFGRRVRRTTLALVMVFMIVFISLTVVIAQQQYWGIQEASAEVARLGYGSAAVLTNVPVMSYTLPQAEILSLNSTLNWTQVNNLIHEHNVTVVVVVHNGRAPWSTISNQITAQLRNLFSGYESKAISDFASYEIFYGTASRGYVQSELTDIVTQIPMQPILPNCA
jgi:4-amino-4-deoxy-L-arabinose transferase-like glycosyltransferase